MGSWRRGYAIDRRAGWAPAIAVPVGTIAVLVNSIRDDGDIRAGVLPWAMVLVVVAFGACALATLSLHGPDPSRWMVAGSWWSAAACTGIAVFFAGIAVGAVLGVEEEDLGAAVIPLVLLMAFGLLSMTPALALLAVGLEKAKRVPGWARLAVWIAAPVLPLLLVYGGLFEGTIETIGSAVLIAAFGIAWLLLGVAVATSRPPGLDDAGVISSPTSQPGS